MNPISPAIQERLARGACRIATRPDGEWLTAFIVSAAADEPDIPVARVHLGATNEDQVLAEDFQLTLGYWLERLMTKARERVADLGRADAARRDAERVS